MTFFYDGATDPAITDSIAYGSGSYGSAFQSSPAAAAGGSAPWYQQTLDFVIRAAAVDRYTPKPVQQTGQYQLDKHGNLAQMGSEISVTGQTSVNNNLVMYAALAVGAVFLFSFLKD